jgi:hypothetical protein
MKKIVSLLFLIFLLHSCSESEFKNGGFFKAENNDLFYAIEINSNLDSIKLFILNEYSFNDSQEILNSRKTFEIYSSGIIKVNGDRIIVSELESDRVPSDRPILEDLIYRNGKIFANCKNLTESFFGKLNFGNCETDFIKFSRMEK